MASDDIHSMRAGAKRSGRAARWSAKGLPLVSIITVALNAKEGLEHVIQEVMAQTYPHREHIIIDGGSTDGSVEVLTAYNQELGYWISEPDRGIYDAMDKGIAVARGAWLFFLGVDDAFYARDTLSSIFAGRPIPEGVDLILGQVHTDRGACRSRFDGWLYLKNTIHHQGAFYARHVFDRFRYCGDPLSDRQRRYFRISGDYRLNLMLYRQGATCIYLDQPVSRCENGLSMEGRLKGYLEEIYIRHQAVGFSKALLFDLFSLLRYVYKKAYRSITGRRREKKVRAFA
jgi:putative colanic acid biosynthesis glycosyltransferase